MKRAAVLTVILVAVGFLAGCGSQHDGTPTSAPGVAAHRAVVPPRVIVVNCLGKQQTRPSNFVLTCADAGDSLTGLHWAAWASTQAFGTGTEKINTCRPNCAEGKFVSYPVLVALWRPEVLPGHPGVLYFTRMTRIYTASRPPLYNCQGTRTCYPLTSTFDLWSD
jgi:hypothetical protein